MNSYTTHTQSKQNWKVTVCQLKMSATDFNRPVSLRGLFGGRGYREQTVHSCPFDKLTLEKGFLNKGQEVAGLLKSYLGCVPRVTIRLTGGRIRALPYT